jgi:hypothetical protein
VFQQHPLVKSIHPGCPTPSVEETLDAFAARLLPFFWQARFACPKAKSVKQAVVAPFLLKVFVV